MGRLENILAVLLIFTVVSCNKEEGAVKPGSQTDRTEVPQSEEGMITLSFTADIEELNGSKTTIDDAGKVQWEAGDAVRVFWSDSGSATMSAQDSGVKTTFSDVSVGVADYYYSVYPDSEQTLNTAENSMSVVIPQSQDGTFASANYIVGRTLAGTTNLCFYYASSVVKFNITRSDITLVTLRSSDGSAIAGTVKADFSRVSSAADTPDFSVTDGSDEISISISGPGTYYAAILPGKELAGGLLFRPQTAEDYLPAAATGLNQASERGKIKNYVVSGGIESKVVTDYYVSSSGSGTKNGKSQANAFDAVKFAEFVRSRADDSEASRSQAFRMYGTTIHVSGTVVVPGPIDISFADGACEKPVGFTIADGTLSGGGTCSILNIGQRASVNLSNLTMSEAAAGSEMGGAVRLASPGASLTADACVFSGNSALEGGAIYIGAGSFTATDCEFSNNSANVEYNYRGGGALKLGGSAAVAELHRCTFSLNSTTGGGGAVSCSSGALHATKCSFIGNTAGKYGGALNAEGSNASIFISKCKISGNNAGSWGTSVAIGDNAVFAANGSIIYGNTSSGSNDAGLFLKGNALLVGNTVIEDVSDKAVLHLAGSASSSLANNIIIGKDETDIAVYMDGTTHIAATYGGDLIGRISGASLSACQAFRKDISDIYNFKYKEFSGATWNPETYVFSWTNGSIYGYYPAKQAAVNTAVSVFGGNFSSWATGVDAYAFTKDISGHQRPEAGLRPGAWEGNNNAMSSSPKRLSVGHLLGYYQWGTSATGVLVMAHRCHINSKDQTENSISAAKQALAAGADILEVDPRPTKDGEIVLCHDKKIEIFVNGRFLSGCDDVDEMNLSEIQSYELVNRKWFGDAMRFRRGTGEKIPTLSEFLSGVGRPRTWYLSLDLEKIVKEYPSDCISLIHKIADIINGAGMMEHTFFYVHKAGAEAGEDKATSLRNYFADWGYPDAAIEIYPYGNSPASDSNYQWVLGFPQNAYSARATYGPGRSPHNLWHVAKDGMVGVVCMLHCLYEDIPEYGLDSGQLGELLTGYPSCHIIQTDTPAELVSALAAKGLRVSRYEDEYGGNAGFDGYSSGNYNW